MSARAVVPLAVVGVAVGAALACPRPARAQAVQTVSYTRQAAVANVGSWPNSAILGSPFKAGFSVPQFPSSLGTLQGVRFTLKAKATLNFNVENTDPYAICEPSFLCSVDTRVRVGNLSDGKTVVTANPECGGIARLAPYDGEMDGAGVSGYSSASVCDDENSRDWKGSLAPFIGDGNLDLSLIAARTYTLDKACSWGGLPSVEAEVTVVYSYVPARSGGANLVGLPAQVGGAAPRTTTR